MDQPNIVMVMADQLPAAALGAYGHPVVKSPHIDSLAARGVVFENCTCNCPLCAPSRASMVTGRLPYRTGVFDNGCELPAQIPTSLHHLRRAGYRTILSGKMHFIGPDQLHGFDERLTTDIYPSFFDWTPNWRKGVYPNPGASVVQLKDAGLSRWNMQLDYDEEVQFRALERLRALARDRADRRPFFLCVSYTHPHEPFIVPREYWDRYDHAAVDMPAARPVPMAQLHAFNRWLQVHHEIDRYPPSDELIRRARHAYYAMISCLDDKVGELLAELGRLGLSGKTAVAFTSDHGEMLGEHGMWFKRTFYDWSARVPMVWSWPGRWDGGRRVGDTVSLVDLFPTLLDIAELPDRWAACHDADGTSFLPLLQGDAGGDRSAICEYYGEGVIHPMRMLCRGTHKYVHVEGHPPLLFDLAADPLEQTSLAGRADVAEVERSMREELLADWDAAAMERQVLASQRERTIIKEAMAAGKPVSWDYQPVFDAATQYVRQKDAQQTSDEQRLD